MYERKAPIWVKSNRCESANCIEVASVGSEVLIRDSRNPTGIVLRVSRGDWDVFAAGVSDGDFQSV